MNPNAKHTPGTWHFFNSGAGLIRSENGKTIAQLKSVSRQGFRKAADLDEEVSNARLIAAAPDLLWALHACLADLTDITQAEGGDPSPAMIQARAAIAQAEGRGE